MCQITYNVLENDVQIGFLRSRQGQRHHSLPVLLQLQIDWVGMPDQPPGCPGLVAFVQQRLDVGSWWQTLGVLQDAFYLKWDVFQVLSQYSWQFKLLLKA